MHIYDNILALTGNTPLVKINRLIDRKDVTVLAKLEGMNPSGSTKDRIAVAMLNRGISEGKLRPGMTVIEATSGNTGIALAMAGAVLGYPVEIAMSASASIERRQMLEAFGATLILTDASAGTDGAIHEVDRLMTQYPHKYFHPDQFGNSANPKAHYATTAEEIWRDTDGLVTHFIAATGSTGTLMGVAERLHEYSPAISAIAAVPELHHKIQGLRNFSETNTPAIFDPARIDRRMIITTEDAFSMTQRLAAEEGILAGMSAGAAMVAALSTAQTAPAGSIIVALLADRGEKYMSTGVFASHSHDDNLTSLPA